MDCTAETPRKAGRPPMTVTLTRAELAAIMGMTPKGVSKRIERGQELTTPKRYGMVKDVTNEPKRKQEPAPDVDRPPAGPTREEVIAGQVKRLREYGSIVPIDDALDTAYTAGFAAGRNSR